MTKLYHRSQVSMEVTKVTLDAGGRPNSYQFWQGTNTYHGYLYPQEGSKFELFSGISSKTKPF